MCHIPIFPDMALGYKKLFGLKFNISDGVNVKVGSTSESMAIIINADRKFYFGSTLCYLTMCLRRCICYVY